jgi:hypothetical protein
LQKGKKNVLHNGTEPAESRALQEDIKARKRKTKRKFNKKKKQTTTT